MFCKANNEESIGLCNLGYIYGPSWPFFIFKIKSSLSE